MKSVLVIGLGNELIGDDGIGCQLVECLALDDELRDGMDFVDAGGDLLRCADQMEGRECVILIDAMLSDAEPGTVSVHVEPFEDLAAGWDHAHGPSAVQEVALLRMVVPALRATRFELIAIAVPELCTPGTLTGRFREIRIRVHDALVAAAGHAR